LPCCACHPNLHFDTKSGIFLHEIQLHDIHHHENHLHGIQSIDCSRLLWSTTLCSSYQNDEDLQQNCIHGYDLIFLGGTVSPNQQTGCNFSADTLLKEVFVASVLTHQGKFFVAEIAESDESRG
jgi:hypothetical protein